MSDDDCEGKHVVIDMDKAPPPDSIGPENKTITWDNRRKMAWSSLIAMFATVIICMFLPLEKLEKLSNIIENVIWAEFSIIAVYMGSTTIPFIWRKQ